MKNSMLFHREKGVTFLRRGRRQALGDYRLCHMAAQLRGYSVSGRTPAQ